MKVIDLSGQWRFSYAKEYGAAAPSEKSEKTIRVPGTWDDQKDAFSGLTLRTNPEYVPVSYPMADDLDASLPYIVGTVFYEREIELTEDTPFASLLLKGVWTEARVWVNGNYAGRAFGYSTPHSFGLDGCLKKGRNVLLIAVDNDPKGHLGCITRGWKGFTGGLCRGVELRLTGECRMKDAAAFAKDDASFLIDVLTEGNAEDAVLSYMLADGETTVLSGECAADAVNIRKEVPADRIECWSDRKAKLYRLKLKLTKNGVLCDERELTFGFRNFKRKGMGLTLNGKPVFLRGATEHAYYPLTRTAPDTVEAYRRPLSILKEMGFNFLRFHTSVPNEEYLTAMDEAGFLVQIEAPVNCSLDEWEDIVRFCRRHPCCCILCAGNEELLDEDKLQALERTADIAHTLAPAALFDPQEALRGIEYGWKETDVGADAEEITLKNGKKLRINRRRLAKIKQFSDVFGHYSWGYLSYDSSDGDSRVLDAAYPMYERPLLCHEAGIYGSYIDLSLEKRYEGTRIGTDMYRLAREYMTREGIMDNRELYLKNSCLLQASVRKANIETIRKCRHTAGFDYLGAIDYHWHHTGYQCGILNEFYEEKPGCTKESVKVWNGERVLLIDNGTQFTFACGETVRLPVLLSNYGDGDLSGGKLEWEFGGECGSTDAAAAACGSVTKLCELELTMPEVQKMLVLKLMYKAGGCTASNEWKLWCFDMSAAKNGCRIVDKLTEADIEALEAGENILLLGTEGFPSQKIAYQPMPSGRTLGMVATVIREHPALKDFPQEGWCDRQFRTLLNGGSALRYGTVNAKEIDAAFDPIIDVCMGYKRAGRYAALAEFSVGKGRLLVSGLNLTGDAPEQKAMKRALTEYMASPCAEAAELDKSELLRLMSRTGETGELKVDKGFDKAGQKAKR